MRTGSFLGRRPPLHRLLLRKCRRRSHSGLRRLGCVILFITAVRSGRTGGRGSLFRGACESTLHFSEEIVEQEHVALSTHRNSTER